MKLYYIKMAGTVEAVCACICSLLLLSTTLHAQGELPKPIIDPLAKPELWAALEAQPTDSAVWARYYSKPMVCLSANERAQWKTLQQQLVSALGEVVVEAMSDYVDWDADSPEETANADISMEQEMIARETETYLVRLEETLTAETSLIKELKENIAMNFFIIEDVYVDEFRQLGSEYTAYQTVYPDGEYSKDKWLKEKERELHKLKRKHFKELEKQIRKNAHKHHRLSQNP